MSKEKGSKCTCCGKRKPTGRTVNIYEDQMWFCTECADALDKGNWPCKWDKDRLAWAKGLEKLRDNIRF